MTFSTIKIGTLEDVKASIRNHHAEGDDTLAHRLAHESASKALVEVSTKDPNDKVMVQVSGHSYIDAVGELSFNYNISVQGLTPSAYEDFKRTWVNNTGVFVSEPKPITNDTE